MIDTLPLEILKKVNKKTGDSREVRVVDAMEDICNLQNFGSYEYSPPKTGSACKYLMGRDIKLTK